MTSSRPPRGHSPAPWYLHAPIDAERILICTVGIDDNIAVVPASPRHDAAANARLISAAPELLEALEYLLRQTVDADLAHGIGLTEGETEAREKGIAAIAKAAGRG